jgi:hypothetical protein
LWKPEDDDDVDDREASDDEDADPEVTARRKAAAAAGHTFYFGPSTVTEDRICELEKLKYFAEGDGRAPGIETVPWDEPSCGSWGYFVAGVRMPLHSQLTKMVLKFRVQLHQPAPNTVFQLSKFFWAVATYGGLFAKRYELQYQQKKVKVGNEVLNAQFGCITFHPNRYRDQAKLTLAVKNKWSAGWTKA